MVDLQSVIVAEFKYLVIIAELDYDQAVLKIKFAIWRVYLKFLKRALLDFSANALDFLNQHSRIGSCRRVMPTNMVLLLNGAIDLSLLILCFLWGSSWCVAVLMIFKCLFRENSGKLNCHIGRILQETKIWMKKKNEAQNVISWFKYPLCFACRSVTGLCHIFYSSQKFSLLKLAKNGSQICLSFSRTSPGVSFACIQPWVCAGM